MIGIFVRHGGYDKDGNLNENGKASMEKIALRVKEVNTNDLPILLLCSTAPRAEQGGKIIMRMLEIPEDQAIFHRCFWNDNKNPGDFAIAKEMVNLSVMQALKEEMVLLSISHLDMVTSLAEFVHKKLGGDGRNIYDLGYGSGWMIDQERQTIEFP